MKPGAGGIKANARAQVPQKQSYGKKTPAKKPGVTEGRPKRGKSPFGK